MEVFNLGRLDRSHVKKEPTAYVENLTLRSLNTLVLKFRISIGNNHKTLRTLKKKKKNEIVAAPDSKELSNDFVGT